MSEIKKLEGGCLCGAIRYSASELPFSSDHCHCSMCRKSVGAVVATWMDFKSEQLSWHGARPKEFASSEHTRRGFCPDCGSTLSFRDIRQTDYITLTNGTLDNPELAPATCHIHMVDKVNWLQIKDDCKRFKYGMQSEAFDGT